MNTIMQIVPLNINNIEIINVTNVAQDVSINGDTIILQNQGSGDIFIKNKKDSNDTDATVSNSFVIKANTTFQFQLTTEILSVIASGTEKLAILRFEN